MVLGIAVFPWNGMQKQEAIKHWSQIAHEAYLWQTRENNQGQVENNQWKDGREAMADEYARACKAISMLNEH
jgi:hypothetical protein